VVNIHFHWWCLQINFSLTYSLPFWLCLWCFIHFRCFFIINISFWLFLSKYINNRTYTWSALRISEMISINWLWIISHSLSFTYFFFRLKLMQSYRFSFVGTLWVAIFNTLTPVGALTSNLCFHETSWKTFFVRTFVLPIS
jgi:hypothetical protein